MAFNTKIAGKSAAFLPNVVSLCMCTFIENQFQKTLVDRIERKPSCVDGSTNISEQFAFDRIDNIACDEDDGQAKAKLGTSQSTNKDKVR